MQQKLKLIGLKQQNVKNSIYLLWFSSNRKKNRYLIKGTPNLPVNITINYFYNTTNILICSRREGNTNLPVKNTYFLLLDIF